MLCDLRKVNLTLFKNSLIGIVSYTYCSLLCELNWGKHKILSNYLKYYKHAILTLLQYYYYYYYYVMNIKVQHNRVYLCVIWKHSATRYFVIYLPNCSNHIPSKSMLSYFLIDLYIQNLKLKYKNMISLGVFLHSW